MNTQLKTTISSIVSNIKSHIVLYSTIVVLGIALLVGSSIYRNRIHDLETKNEIYVLKEKLSKQTIDSIKNATGKIIQRQQAVITNNQDAINSLSAESFNLKKRDEKNLNTIALLKSAVELRGDTIRLTYHDTIPVEIKGKDSIALVNYINNSMITVPRKANIDSPYISIYQTITKQGVILDSLKAEDSLIQRVVENTNGIFKKSTYEVQSFHTNKLFKNKAEQSLIFVPKQKNRLLEYIISAGIGAITSYYILKH